jgi:hypothetical protein
VEDIEAIPQSSEQEPLSSEIAAENAVEIEETPPEDISPLSKSSQSIIPPTRNTRDGVFSNISAKPQVSTSSASVVIPNEDDKLPEYDQIAQDAVPPYTQDTNQYLTHTTELYEGLPIGTNASFILSFAMSALFQTLGFAMMYILSLDHAGRDGAKAGFGITMISFALNQSNFAGEQSDGVISGAIFILGVLVLWHSVHHYYKARKSVNQVVVQVPVFSFFAVNTNNNQNTQSPV